MGGRLVGCTTVQLYRKGNATSARLDHVRQQDIEHFDVGGVPWVRAGTGGISTNAVPLQDGGRWWQLPAGYDYGNLLVVWNDADAHWSWEPKNDMTLSDFRALLSLANQAFLP